MSEHEKRTAERIEEIRARALASTEGPFVLVERGFGDYDVDIVRRAGRDNAVVDMAGVRGMFARKEDAEFFSRAREDLLALLDVIDGERRRRSG